jgi:threonylcarbamoyladenosine tRNA methylthiotransferase MtaB
MKRRWSSRMFVNRCNLVRETLDQPAITTDIIVGFPGETEADFAATCQVSRDSGFSKIHIFPFSARKGTPAAEMTDVVAPDIKSDRCNRLATVERELRNKYFASLIGRCLTVLPEGHSEANPTLLRGTSCRYAPVEFPAGMIQSGALVKARATAVKDDHLVAELATGSL